MTFWHKIKKPILWLLAIVIIFLGAYKNTKNHLSYFADQIEMACSVNKGFKLRGNSYVCIKCEACNDSVES